MKNQTNFETLNKKVNVKKIILGVGALAIIGVAVVGKITHASYSSTISVPLVNGKITYKHPDFRIMAIHVKDSSGNYVEQDRMPNSGYMINESKTYCTKGPSSEKDTEARIYTDDTGQHVISNLLKNDRCYLYFDEFAITAGSASELLTKLRKDDSRSGEITVAFKKKTPITVYSKADDTGTSYMFAGVNPNNWVKLGNLYFRIIRFNGDGSLRLIYSGEGSPATSGTGTQIGTSKFNASYNDNMYVGLQYTSGQVHGTDQNSTILGETNSTDLTTLYGWYNNKVKPSYESIIESNAGFCSDRDNYTNNTGTDSGGGIGTTPTYYGADIRYLKEENWQTSYTPVLSCKNASDNLKLPVGLITADEYILAGGGIYINGYDNETFWLHTGENYWTMSPNRYSSDTSWMFIVYSFGVFFFDHVRNTFGVRPVINLKTTTTFSGGIGTSTDPYIVKV